MPEENSQDKTEQATPKRREEAKKKGKIALSKEIPSVLILASSLMVFYFAGTWMFWSLSDFMRGIYQNIGTMQLDSASAGALLMGVFEQIFFVLLPLLIAVILAGISGNLAQIGFLFTGEPMTPKLSKLDPVKGMKKLFSVKALVELFKSLFKISIIGGIAYVMLKGEMDNLPALMQMSVGEILSFISRISFKTGLYTCLVLIILSAFDYAFQRWQHEKELKMSKQEVKDELKQREGDPYVKARIRKLQVETSRRRMMEAVPDADVIITNPTRLAIALQFNANEMLAPKVTAKGAGFLAERIRKIAKDNNIPLVEHKPLAQTLYKMAEIGDYIPADLYRAVAEILAYVYRLKGIR